MKWTCEVSIKLNGNVSRPVKLSANFHESPRSVTMIASSAPSDMLKVRATGILVCFSTDAVPALIFSTPSTGSLMSLAFTPAIVRFVPAASANAARIESSVESGNTVLSITMVEVALAWLRRLVASVFRSIGVSLYPYWLVYCHDSLSGTFRSAVDLEGVVKGIVVHDFIFDGAARDLLNRIRLGS